MRRRESISHTGSVLGTQQKKTTNGTPSSLTCRRLGTALRYFLGLPDVVCLDTAFVYVFAIAKLTCEIIRRFSSVNAYPRDISVDRRKHRPVEYIIQLWPPWYRYRLMKTSNNCQSYLRIFIKNGITLHHYNNLVHMI